VSAAAVQNCETGRDKEKTAILLTECSAPTTMTEDLSIHFAKFRGGTDLEND